MTIRQACVRAVVALAAAVVTAGAVHAQPPGVTISEGRWRAAEGGDLFVFLRDPDPVSCADPATCVNDWAPLEAEPGTSKGLWTIVVHRDGASQWAYRWWPVYTRLTAWTRAEPMPPNWSAWAMGEDGMHVIDGADLQPDLLTTMITKQLPDYPAASLRAAEQGLATVGLCLTKDGGVAYPRVVGSSGSARLDDASVRWLSGVRYMPVLSDGGPAAICNLRVEINWRLQGYGETQPAKPPG